MTKYLSFFILMIWTSVLVKAEEEIEIVVQKGHLSSIKFIEFSPNEQYLCSVDESNDLILWNLKFGKELARFKNRDIISACVFSPESNYLISGHENGMMKIWDLKETRLIKKLQLKGKINDFEFDNEKLLVVASNFYSYSMKTQRKTLISPNKYVKIEKRKSGGFIGISNFQEVHLLNAKFEVEQRISLLVRDNKDEEDKKERKFFSDIDISKIVIDGDKELIYFQKLNTINVFDIAKEKVIKSFSTDYFDIEFTSVDFSNKNSMIVSGTTDDKIFVKSMSGMHQTILTPHLSEVTDVCFSEKANYFATASSDQSIIIWDATTLKQVHRLNLRALPIYTMDWNSNANKLALGNHQGEVKLVDFGKDFAQLSINNYHVHTEIVSDIIITDSLIMSTGFDNLIVIQNIKDAGNDQMMKLSRRKTLKEYQPQKKSLAEYKSKLIFSIQLDEDFDQIYLFGRKGFKLINRSYKSEDYAYVRQIDTDSLNLISECGLNYVGSEYSTIETYKSNEWGKVTSTVWINKDEYIQNKDSNIVFFDNQGVEKQEIELKAEVSNLGYSHFEKLIVFGVENRVGLIREENVIYLGNHEDVVTSFEFIEDWGMLLSSSLDGTVKFWDYNKHELVCTLVPIDRNKLILYTPDNYYYSINDANTAIGFKMGIEYFPVEQFDLKYNRPDIVLERLGYADSTLIDAYHFAYLKRLKKMNFTEEMLKGDFHLPELYIENREGLPVITDLSSVELDLNLNDSKFKLDRINVWVNDVAVYGLNGISLREENTFGLLKSVKIELALGLNRIQVSVLNQAGAESYKETLEIECTAGKDKSNLYIVGIGVSDYKNENYNLTYAAKDALDMTNTFKKNKYFENVFTKTLTNEEVILENLMGLKSFLLQADINDQVIVFVAGHGVLDANFDYYYGSYDMDFLHPSKRGIPYEMLESILDGIKPLKKLLFMDTCHSGEVDKDEIQLSESDEDEEDGEIIFRDAGVSVENRDIQLGLGNTSELMKGLFTDLRKGTGATVISSAGGVEVAMEGDTWKNGLFTYCLISGLTSKKADLNKDKMITVSEIQLFVQSEVNRLSGGKQTPTSRIENNTLDYRVW